jgi:hypothetical protein
MSRGRRSRSPGPGRCGIRAPGAFSASSMSARGRSGAPSSPIPLFSSRLDSRVLVVGDGSGDGSWPGSPTTAWRSPSSLCPGSRWVARTILRSQCRPALGALHLTAGLTGGPWALFAPLPHFPGDSYGYEVRVWIGCDAKRGAISLLQDALRSVRVVRGAS